MTISANTTGGNKIVQGAAITLTRPNNTTAYAAGQVWGDAVDARIALPVPANPADAAYAFTLMNVQLIRGRPKADAQASLFGTVFESQPATVLGDGALMNLSDADIALVIPTSTNPVIASYSSSIVIGVLNQSAAGAGRAVSARSGNPLTGYRFVPGTTVYMYLRLGTLNAYVPVANEVLVVTPIWIYVSKPLV